MCRPFNMRRVASPQSDLFLSDKSCPDKHPLTAQCMCVRDTECLLTCRLRKMSLCTNTHQAVPAPKSTVGALVHQLQQNCSKDDNKDSRDTRDIFMNYTQTITNRTGLCIEMCLLFFGKETSTRLPDF